MSELNKVNRGFEVMLPKAQEEEVKPKCCHDHKISLFGLEFRFLFTVNSFREKD